MKEQILILLHLFEERAGHCDPQALRKSTIWR